MNREKESKHGKENNRVGPHVITQQNATRGTFYWRVIATRN